MISVAPSYVPQQSGLSQPTMSACPFFGVNAVPLRFGVARPVLSPGHHRSVLGGASTASLRPPTVGRLDRYDTHTP